MKCGLEVSKTLTVGGGELHQVTVGHHPATLGVDMALGVDHLEKATADLQGLDAATESTGEEAVEHVLDAALDCAFCHAGKGSGATEWAVGKRLVRSQTYSREWRNGRRAGFRCQCSQGRGGSSPPSRTSDFGSLYQMDSFEVIENVRLSHSTFRLRTQRPAVQIKAGQCFSVGTKELGVNREYSMYSAAEDPFIDFLIREVEDGIVTPALGKCKSGDRVEIGGPYGEFCLPPQWTSQEKFVFIASGTGIAPFHSYVKSYPELDYIVLHGIRCEDEQYEKDDYEPGRYFPAVSQPSSGVGQRVTDVLQSMDLDPAARYYLCGNRSMITDAVSLLREKGVPGGQILMETFF